MARPRAGEWLRDEIESWRNAGVEGVVSLLEAAEVRELELGEEKSRGVPTSIPSTRALIDGLVAKMEAGSSIAIHWRAGIGRSSLIAACVLHRFGVKPDEAFERISHARGISVPDTTEQRAWLSTFAQK
jgi:hypothetical protein